MVFLQMRGTWSALLPLAFIAACGGAVDDPARSAQPGGEPGPESSGQGTGGGGGGGGAGGAARAPDAAPTTGPAKGPSIALGAETLTAVHHVLGAARAKPNDRCSTSSRRSTLTLATHEVAVETCVREGDGPAAMAITGRRTLDARERAEVDALLADLREKPQPASCAYDGQMWGVTILRDGVSTDYLIEDYNCQHASGVKYVYGDVRRLEAVLALPE